MKDRLGVDIRHRDQVMISAWGTGRLIDVGTRSKVVRLNRVRIVIIDSDRRERAIHPNEVAVLRRDGAPGFEGNISRPNAWIWPAKDHYPGCL